VIGSPFTLTSSAIKRETAPRLMDELAPDDAEHFAQVRARFGLGRQVHFKCIGVRAALLA